MKKIYIIAIALIIIGGGYYWYKKSKLVSGIPTYKTAVAKKGALISSISGSGNVIVDQLATVDPTITGTVSNLFVKVGDSVKKGQVLFVIKNDELGVSVSRAQASYAQSKKALDDAKYAKKQAKIAYEDNQTKDLKDRLALAEDAIGVSEQSLAASRADYYNKIADASERTVKAPIDGTVNAVNVKNGDDLSRLSSSSASQAPIIIGDLGTLKAEVQVNEVDIPNVAIGQKVTLKLSAIEDLAVSGKVEKVDSLGTITQGVVTYNVTIDFDEIDPRIRPQMSISASIITSEKENVITVPNSALKTEGNRNFVEVLTGKTVRRKPVEIGAMNNTETEITSGLSVGDAVITQTIDASATAKKTSTGNSNVRIPGLGGGR